MYSIYSINQVSNIKKNIGKNIKNGIKNTETINHLCLNIFLAKYIYTVEPTNMRIKT